MLFAVGGSLVFMGTAAYLTEKSKVEKEKEAYKRRMELERVEASGGGGFSGLVRGLFGASDSVQQPPSSSTSVYQQRTNNKPPDSFFERLAIILGANVSDLTPPMRVIYTIIGLNTLVFAAWQIPRASRFMSRFFLHWAPDAGKKGTMLLSAFSHMSLPHLGFNMLALYSFGSMLAEGVFSRPPSSVSQQQGSWNLSMMSGYPDYTAGAYEFTAFFLSGCVLSSLASQLNNVLLFRRAPVGSNVAPSLGASGGVYSIVAAVALLFPWTSVNVFLIPVALRLGTVFPIMLSVDLVGMLLRWQSFDHAAHLGGALWGLAYMKYGREWYEGLRSRIRKGLVDRWRKEVQQGGSSR